MKINDDKKRLAEVLVLAAVIIFSSVQIYGIHSEYTGRLRIVQGSMNYRYVQNAHYPYPIHGDEWYHIAQSIYIMENGKGFVNPYSFKLPFHMDMEYGYHLFLAAAFMLLGTDPVISYQYFPAAFFAINSLMLFLFTRRFTGSTNAGIVSVLFFLALPSNVYMTGNWFATPLTFSVSLLLGFMILLDRFSEDMRGKTLALLILFFACIAMVYPLAALTAFILSVFHVAVKLEIYKKKIFRENMFQICAAALAFSAIAVVLLSDYVIFSTAWTPAIHSSHLPLFYGPLPFLAAFLGMVVALKKKMPPVLVCWPAMFLVFTMSYVLTGHGVLYPFVRSVYYLLLGIVPLASVGLIYAVLAVRNFMENHIKLSNHYVLSALMLALVLSNFLMVFNYVNNSYEEEFHYSIYHIIEDPQYKAMLFIAEEYGQGNNVLADNFMALAVYPISRNHVVALQPGNLGHGKPKLVHDFFDSDCALKREIMGKVQPTIVFYMKPVYCDFLTEVYADHEGAYVYEVNQ